MANTRSAAKRSRQTAVRTLRNRAHKVRIKASRKKVVQAIASGDASAAQTALNELASVADKAIKVNALHRNVGSRFKRDYSRRISALASQAS